MALTINSSVYALRAQRSIDQNQNTLSSTLRKLSSGLRINTAADDPGRLGISILAESQTRSLRQSIRNLNDGISLTQTLEGGLARMEDMLQRLRQLSVQAASETLSDVDRSALQLETHQIIEGMNKIVEQSTFNGINLMDGSVGAVEIFTEASDGGGFQLGLVKIDTQAVNRQARYVSQRRGVYLGDLETGDLKINGINIRGTGETDDSVSFSFASGSAIAKANAINAYSEVTGVRARAAVNEIIANRAISAFDLDTSDYFAINGVQISGMSISDFDADGRLRHAINSVAEETGVVASLDHLGQLKLTAEDGRNIQIHYSSMSVMISVGLADTSGDETNLKGEVRVSSLFDTDLYGSIQNVVTDFNNSYLGNFSVGGEFDPGRDHVDYVAQVIKAGGYGTAQFRLARETGSEINAAEDYAHLDVDGPYLTGHAAGMEFFSVSPEDSTNGVTGSISSDGTYNEGADRIYTITVTQEGSTDGAVKAVGDISSNVDGVIKTGVTLSETITLGTALHQTGEFVTLTLSGTPRGQSVYQGGDAQPYSAEITQALGALKKVIVKGTYDADIDLIKEVRVVETGYTQGINKAKLQVFDSFDGGAFVASDPAFEIMASTFVDIGHGLSIKFAPQLREFDLDQFDTINAGGTQSSYDSTGLDVTLSSTTLQYFGERGDGEYILKVSEAGRTGNAKYEVFFDDGDGPVLIEAERLLTAGEVDVSDGIKFTFEESTPTIVNDERVFDANGSDHYGAVGAYASPNFTFGGVYTGDMNDTTARVEVTKEGRVLAADEVSTGDAAELTYTIAKTVAGGTITGVTLARVGTFTVGEGVTFEITQASALTEFKLGGVAKDDNFTFDAGSILGYNGEVTVNLDPLTYDRDRDATIRISEIGNVVVGSSLGDPALSGKLKVELIDENNVILTAASFSVVSGTSNIIDTGLSITFDNTAFSSVLIEGDVTNDDDGTIGILAGSRYNSALGDREYVISYNNILGQDITQTSDPGVGNDVAGINDGTIVGSYTGLFGDQDIDITFEGTTQSVTRSAIGGADVAALTITGVYSGLGGDKSLTVKFLGDTINRSATALPPDETFSVAAEAGARYNGLSGDVNFTVKFSGDVQQNVQQTNFNGAVVVNSKTAFSEGVVEILASFTADNALKLSSGGSEFTYTLTNNGGVNPIDLDEIGLASVSLDITTILDEDESLIPQSFTITFSPQQKVTISDDNSLFEEDIIVTGASINLGSATLTGAGKLFTAGDPGFDLSFTNSKFGGGDSVSFTLKGPRASVSDGVNDAVIRDISLGEIDLNHNDFNDMFAEGNPDVVIKIDSPELSDNDSWTVDLKTKGSVTLTGSNDIVSGVTLSNTGRLDLNLLTFEQKEKLFGNTSGFNLNDGLGVAIDFTDFDLQIDDTFRLQLSNDPSIHIEEVGGDGVSADYLIGDDFGPVNVNFADIPEIGVDLGFNLILNDPILGIDDRYTLTLTGASVVADEVEIIDLDAKTLQEGDYFTADLIADELEIGSEYRLNVTAPHLNVGHIYTVKENVGTLKVGETLTVGPINSLYDPTVYTIQPSVTITDGLNLNFSANGPFEVGDEMRFQARGYRGNISAFGQYTDPAYPTTFMVEVTQTGDVGTDALLKTTRLDTGEVVSTDVLAVTTADVGNIGGPGYLGLGVFLQFDANAGVGEAHRLYEGDTFYVDVIGSLSQNFASQLILESDDNIEIEYADANVDNEVGRLLYVGDDDLVNNPGTIDSLTSAILGVNTQYTMSKIDLGSQENAEEALRLVDHAIAQLSEVRTTNGAAQNRMSREIISLEEAVLQTERYHSQIRDADFAEEVARRTQAQIIQNAGIEMLQKISRSNILSLQLVRSLLD